MKRVSFKVAKAIKEAGYPQKGNVHSHYYDNEHKETFVPFECNRSRDYLAPTYLEVWLWLWREKGIEILSTYNEYGCVRISFGQDCEPKILRFHNGKSVSHDPEEAIVTAVEYLVDNKLLK